MAQNRRVTAYASTARTATPSDVEVPQKSGDSGRGIIVTIDVTAITASPSVVFNIRGKDALSESTYLILASAAVTGTGTTVLMIGENMIDEANLSANALIPNTIVVDPVHGDSDSITYTVSVEIVN
ncbi:hypothetical protein CMI47_04420 [Candidatus Pacearchaeota archaeon]|jgi:hypothetical protein|nr:hypothetical protein [Candidatus Pacearchaeota archaeon]|tara:strand:+ start:2922 stop:3299 length:378 start_codon:yes stop_codon:yes gene_type:complete